MNFRTYISILTKVLSYFFFPFVICAIGYDLWHMVNVGIYWIAVLVYGFLYCRPLIYQWRQDQFNDLNPYIEIKQIVMKNLSRNIINCDKEQANSFGTSREYIESEIVLALFSTFDESAGCSINILKY